MSILASLHHRSLYRYDRAVGHAPHVIRLRPAPHCRTRIISYALRVQPKDHFLNWQQDPFGNYLARLVFPGKSNELLVEVDLVAEMAVWNPFDFFLEESANQWPFTYEAGVAKELLPFLEKLPGGPRFAKYVAGISREKRSTIDFLVDLNRALHLAIRYVIRLEPGVQSPERTLELGSGSCRDSAWLLVQILRHLGLAARFASGYLIQLTPDVKALDGPSGTDKDFTDLHAWTEVYLPGGGWIGLDPTSGLLAGEGHIPLACTPEPSSAAPISGATDPCDSTFAHHMEVSRVKESPRVTKPYSDEQWSAIDRLGHAVDFDLKAMDMRLTMGGEPTFVSIDDPDGEEWNFTALGERKRRLAGDLLRRMQNLFAPGGLLHFGQGKWYPGEILPRWALGCWWRKDGVALWRDASLVPADDAQYGHTAEHAARFLAALTPRLGLPTGTALAGHEDVFYYLWRERRLPVNVAPSDARLKDEQERARLARLFEEGIGKPVGYVLPLCRNAADAAWLTGPWTLRGGTLYLIPGDSPMGYRLPLDSLPWAAPAQIQPVVDPDPTVVQPPLPSEEKIVLTAAARKAAAARAQSQSQAQAAVKPPPPPAVGTASPETVRTALCVEPRGGVLHAFMPPLPSAEAYLELVAAIEDTAAELKLPIRIEGTQPPHDPRLTHFKVTPDPGVIEVNLHPSTTWAELSEKTTLLYEEARQSRLGVEKFLVDGRHTGTGGGNHIVIGGETPADSPLLRRPDLLRSLVTFWQNHPSLSFLFSGLFIGPTSQHPRVDEARHEALYELEIAFKQLSNHEPAFPWLVDRLFRNLLTDMTGNTHRAEFSIDKLFDPGGVTGRLGLLELRAFEMPPHSRMSLVQHLLLRALLARFWKEPLHRPLVRWGTELHDRFLLPHFVRQDLEDVLGFLSAGGYPFDPAWFAPHLEFRFPICGEFSVRGMHVELRQALEPWHVLGEHGVAGGTSRAVDSSLDRLQVRVRGLGDRRHVLTCNGRALPLHPTGVEGEFVAGIRYRAWQPPDCLHPTIGVHSPLTLDLVDTWNRRSLGGCVYHVAHPGGRSTTSRPINAFEAESRRLSRFSLLAHTPGEITVALPAVNPEFPFTLDLRRD